MVRGEPEAAAVALLRRRSRLRRRSGRPWFDRLLDFYVAAVAVVVVLSAAASVVGGDPSAAVAEFAATRGAAAVGVIAGVAVAAGLRSGAFGGPLHIQRPDVLLVLMSPAPQEVFLRPRVRRAAITVVAMSAGIGGLALATAATRLGVEPVWFLASGAAAGAAIGAIHFGAALIANAAELDPPVATALAVAVVGLATANFAFASMWNPFASIGAVALWPLQEAAAVPALLAVVVPVGVLVTGMKALKRVNVEAALARSSAAATVLAGVGLHDLRALMVAAHSRPDEQFRANPWTAAPPPSTWAAWRRSWRGLLRMPTTRLVRVAGCGAIMGLSAAASWTVPPAAVFGVAAAYLAGLEMVEPIAQMIDRPTARTGYPRAPASIYRAMLPASTAAMAAVFALAALTAFVAGAAEPALLLLAAAVPGGFAATSSAVYVLARGRPDERVFARFVTDTTGAALYLYHLGPAVAAGSAVVAIALVARGASIGAAGLTPVMVGMAMLVGTSWVTRSQR